MISTNQSTVSLKIWSNERCQLWWKRSEARREEEQEREAREFQHVWQSSSQPGLSTLAQSEDLLDQLHSADLSLVKIYQDTVL